MLDKTLMVCYNSSMTIEKPQTFNQINQQISANYRNGSEKGPTVLVRRSSGSITVAEFNPNSQKMEFTGEDGRRYTKSVLSSEAVSDQYQENLAAELGADLGAPTEVLSNQRRETVSADLAERALSSAVNNGGRFGMGAEVVDQPGPQAIRQAAAMPGSGIVDRGNGRYYQS